jgi:nucleoside-diphosphate-sugar epimerase
MKSTITIVGCGWLGFPLGISLLKEEFSVYGSGQSQEKVDSIASSGMHGFLYSEFNTTSIPSDARKSDFLIINFPPSKSSDYAQQVYDLIEQFSSETKVVLTSSTSVYKDIDALIDENAERNNEHAVTLAEDRVINSGHDYCIFRLAGLIDETRHPIKFLSGRETQNALGKVNLVHKQDVINAIVKQLKTKDWNTIYNVCSPEHPSRRDYYSQTAISRGIPLPIFVTEGSIGKEISSQKLIETLDFQFNQSIFF